MTEPEQWAVDLAATIRRASLTRQQAALTIQRAFEERTGQLSPSGDATAAAFEVGQQTYERVGVTPAMREVMELFKSNRAATSQPSGDEVEGRVIAEVVAWCLREMYEPFTPLERAKALKSITTALETGEWKK